MDLFYVMTGESDTSDGSVKQQAFEYAVQLNNMNCANRFVAFPQGLRTKRSKMKDDYHLPVVTRPEREARCPGIKKQHCLCCRD
ncbi:hypothetical protein J0Q64_003828 [Salmonella enterica subsp. enterica serovar Newport]|nr:hypothetical protein [Salmonella enterica subsp. enterica serovar Newport]EHJ5407616.1 hypothetical protein [Salmonella enterica subsp. enterica serovar Wedding]EJA5030140.1 hypothetical protein [Salmonella enterica]EJA5054564.1 hypothetical protein [Salmonella enterica]EJA5151017.1 hypothetical protein [Salmonella enterica]